MTYQPTRYEIALSLEGARLKVLGYSARKTRGALIDFARANGPEILSLMRPDEADQPWSYSDGALTFANRVRVAFTGQTERGAKWEAIAKPQPAFELTPAALAYLAQSGAA